LEPPHGARSLIAGKSSGGSTGEQIEPILSDRQREVLELVALGYSDEEIAERLHLSTPIVKEHIRDILKALGVPDRTSAALAALRRGLIE
jgi:two-component system, NarL family, response regulator LiaR